MQDPARRTKSWVALAFVLVAAGGVIAGVSIGKRNAKIDASLQAKTKAGPPSRVSKEDEPGTVEHFQLQVKEIIVVLTHEEYEIGALISAHKRMGTKDWADRVTGLCAKLREIADEIDRTVVVPPGYESSRKTLSQLALAVTRLADSFEDGELSGDSAMIARASQLLDQVFDIGRRLIFEAYHVPPGPVRGQGKDSKTKV